MSKGVPIAQRPDLKDASLSTRLDAVFGALGPTPGAGGWSLRQDVQPFRAGGGIEEYNYSSDEEDPNENLRPLMPSRLVDSDDEDAAGATDDNGSARVPALERADPDADADEADIGREQSEARAARERERMRASLSSRRAFEAEAEEDEYDRVATGTMDLRNRLTDAKPPGFTEVPLDSAWERMHGRWQQQQEQQQQQEPEVGMPVEDAGALGSPPGGATAPTAIGMDISPAVADGGGGGGGGGGAAAARKRPRSGTAAAGDVTAGDVEMLGPVGEDGGADPDAPGNAPVASGRGFAGATSDSIGGQLGTPGGAGGAGAGPGAAATAAAAVVPAVAEAEAQQPAPRQRGGRRVQWADFVAASRPAGDAGGGDASAAAVGEEIGADRASSNGHHRAANGGGAAGGRGRGGGGRVRLDWQRRGFVPDHVRNPHKYTMYTLDEELVVGGGERAVNGRNGRNGASAAPTDGVLRGGGGGGGGGGGSDEMRQALAQARRAIDAANRAEHDPDRAETTFGSGIAFRPRAARQQAPPQQHASDRLPTTAAADQQQPQAHGNGVAAARRGAFTADGDGADEAGEGQGLAAGGSAAALRRGGGRRQFRARPRRAEEEEEGGGGGGAGGTGGGGPAEGGAAAADGDAMQQD